MQNTYEQYSTQLLNKVPVNKVPVNVPVNKVGSDGVDKKNKLPEV